MIIGIDEEIPEPLVCDLSIGFQIEGVGSFFTVTEAENFVEPDSCIGDDKIFDPSTGEC